MSIAESEVRQSDSTIEIILMKRTDALIAIFLVGSIAVIASGIRLYSIWIYLKSDDVSYDAIFVSCTCASPIKSRLTDPLHRFSSGAR